MSVIGALQNEHQSTPPRHESVLATTLNQASLPTMLRIYPSGQASCKECARLLLRSQPGRKENGAARLVLRTQAMCKEMEAQMPFWKRSSPEDEQRLMQELQEAEASQRSLEAGGLPTQAIRRLKEETAAGHPVFSSDLSTNEFLLARNSGYIALSQVMGSSIYQVGWQYTRNYSSYSSLYELTTLSNAHQHAAQLALGRLEQEASLLKAHGVIGVRLAIREYEWGSNLMEYTAIGTAVRLQNVSPPARPFLSDLSGQEFWTLLQAGYYPVGMVTGYCSYCVSSGWDLNQRLRSWYNQEISEYTQAVYEARGLAMSRVESMARKLNAFGIVGVHIGYQKQLQEYESEQTGTHRDLFVHFSAVGTAITAQRKDHVIPSPKPTLSFTDLRPGQRGETRELTIRE